MEGISVAGIYLIKQMQEYFSDQKVPLMLISHFGDPKYAYTFHFPIIFALSQLCGLRLIYSAAVGEFLNLVLKWFIQEGRPYWYVHENSDICGNLTLEQFPITCETGPGSPSGHVMISTAFWFVAASELSSKLNIVGSILVHCLFLTGISLIAASRMFLAAHFPHQCVLGFTIGLGFGYFCSRLSLHKLSSKTFGWSSVVIFGLTFGSYWLLTVTGQDPNRSIKLAIKWCVKPEYVHLDTSPLFCCMRFSGTMLGCGLAMWKIRWLDSWKRRPWFVPVLMAVLNMLACQAVMYCPMPSNIIATYALNFTLYTVLFVFLVRIGPELISSLPFVKEGGKHQ